MLIRLVCVTVLIAIATFGPMPVRAQPPPPVPRAARATSVTLSQIVARQEENFARIRNARGQVSWTEQRTGGHSSGSAQASAVIFFAIEENRSVNLVLPAGEAAVYAQNQGQINWPRVLSAVAIEDGAVQTIIQPAGTATPQVRVTAFNPAVHGSNPLISFHPRMLGEERIRLSELAAAAPRMTTPPQVSEVSYDRRPALRIDFVNPAAPGEAAHYIVDPAKGYLPLEIRRISGGHLVNRVQIVIGNTKDGTWIPARRERLTFNQAGRTIERESWHYDFLAVNEGLSRKGATLAFFQLPPATKVIKDGQASPGSSTAGVQSAQSSPLPQR